MKRVSPGSDFNQKLILALRTVCVVPIPEEGSSVLLTRKNSVRRYVAAGVMDHGLHDQIRFRALEIVCLHNTTPYMP
jgi:hypothetical protein